MAVSSRASESGKLTGPRDEFDCNREFYERSDLLASYVGGELRPPEAVIFGRYREELTGKVLEVGCGGGRLIARLTEISSDVHGIDVSARMVEHCRLAHPRATFARSDMRDLAEGEGSFDVVLAPFNVIDAVGHADRQRTLHGFRRVLAPGGLLVISSHNLGHAAQVVGPLKQIPVWLRARELRAAAVGVIRLPRRARNRRRLRSFERRRAGHAILNDFAHNYSLLHYYISSSLQARQLSEHGFELLECLDLAGRSIDVGDPAPNCPEIHYVARLRDRAWSTHSRRRSRGGPGLAILGSDAGKSTDAAPLSARAEYLHLPRPAPLAPPA